MRTSGGDIALTWPQWRDAGSRPPRLIIRRSFSRRWWWRCNGCAQGVDVSSQPQALAQALEHRSGDRCRYRAGVLAQAVLAA